MKIIIKKLAGLTQFVEVEDGLLNVLNGCTVRAYDNQSIAPFESTTVPVSDNNDDVQDQCIKALQLTFQNPSGQSEGKTYILQDLQIEKFVMAMIYQSEQLASE